MREPILSRAPVHRSGMENLVHDVDLEGTGRLTPVTFEREVAWIRDTDTYAILRNGRRDLAQLYGHNDFYGPLTCVPGAIQEASGPIADYGISADSFLRIDLVLTVQEIPVMPPGPEPVKEYGRWRYEPCPKDWKLAALVPAWEAAAVAERVEQDIPPPYVRPRTVFKGPVWSSRWMGGTVEEQAEACLGVIARVVPDAVDDALRSSISESLATVMEQVREARSLQAKAGV
jgi:hypothetical protein